MPVLEPRFPVTNAWVTNSVHAYMPRDIRPSTMRELAKKLLCDDKPFRHLLRECKDHWYIAVLVGKTTLSLDIYVSLPENSFCSELVSQPSYRHRCVFFKVDRNLEFEVVDDITERCLRSRCPSSYSIRHLRSNEITVCDTMIEMLEPSRPLPPTSVTDDGFAIDHSKPDYDLEPASPFRDIQSD